MLTLPQQLEAAEAASEALLASRLHVSGGVRVPSNPNHATESRATTMTDLELITRALREDRTAILDAMSRALHAPLTPRTRRELLELRQEAAQALHLIDTLLPAELMGQIRPLTAASPSPGGEGWGEGGPSAHSAFPTPHSALT